MEVVYSQILTGTEEVDAELNPVTVYYRNGEVRIDVLPENELVTVYSDTGTQIYSGYDNRIPVDKSLAVVVVQTGSKVYKIAVR